MSTKRKVRKSEDRAIIEYIKSMLLELRGMSEANRDDMLTYMIEMAYMEASDRLREIHALERVYILRMRGSAAIARSGRKNELVEH